MIKNSEDFALSEDQLNCRIEEISSNATSFWKANDTVRDYWGDYFGNNSEFDNLNYDNLFDRSLKTEPAQEYWL